MVLSLVLLIGGIIILIQCGERTGEPLLALIVVGNLILSYIIQPINALLTEYNPFTFMLNICLYFQMAKILHIRDAEDLIGAEVEICKFRR